MKSSRGFTLIELLIVIAIIGILMALLFPAIGTALDAAKKAQAKNDVTQLATAIIAYEVEYGRLPATNSSPAAITGEVLQALMGSTNGGLNPRGIVFFEGKNAKNNKGGYNTNTYLDPWGGSYYVAYDGDYDNTLDNSTANSITGTSIRKKVILFNTNTTVRKRVASWE